MKTGECIGELGDGRVSGRARRQESVRESSETGECQGGNNVKHLASADQEVTCCTCTMMELSQEKSSPGKVKVTVAILK